MGEIVGMAEEGVHRGPITAWGHEPAYTLYPLSLTTVSNFSRSAYGSTSGAAW